MSLEQKKKQLELERVKLSKRELEFKIEERLEEIERLKAHVKVQDEAIAKLEKETQ